MPRTKGSKNKPKTVTTDYATQIAEKQCQSPPNFRAFLSSNFRPLKHKKSSRSCDFTLLSFHPVLMFLLFLWVEKTKIVKCG